MITTVSSLIFDNIFQGKHDSVIKSPMGDEKIMSFRYQNLRVWKKKSEKYEQAP